MVIVVPKYNIFLQNNLKYTDETAFLLNNEHFWQPSVELIL